tara:strand:+ start:5405 stop:6133 length:729 start_codon:yes stop_codon:yes gene_type:complete
MTSANQDLTFYITSNHPCSYLEDKEAKTVYLDPNHPISYNDYQLLTHNGFRRSGDNLYTPKCDGCNGCLSSRVRVRDFTPTRKQRRILRKNKALTLHREKATFNNEHYALYEKYINQRHCDGEMYPASEKQYKDFLFSRWANTDTLEFRLSGEIVAVAFIDVLEDGLSAIYTFFDPDFHQHSLGVYCILKQIELCQQQQFDYLYLGFWINGCQKMRYKAEYQPLELYLHGFWQQYDTTHPFG